MTKEESASVREDHNPFILAPFVVGGEASFLIFCRWTDYRYPHCHHVFRREFWPDNVRLGSAERLCKYCGKIFDDGSREWPVLALGKRLRYFLPPGMLAAAGGGLFCAIFTLLLRLVTCSILRRR
jgi:hypothetical protein